MGWPRPRSKTVEHSRKALGAENEPWKPPTFPSLKWAGEKNPPPPTQADYSSSPSSPWGESGMENEFFLVRTQRLAPPAFAVTAGPPPPAPAPDQFCLISLHPDHDAHSFLTTPQPTAAEKFQERKVREPGGWDRVVAEYVPEQIPFTAPEQPARMNWQQRS